MRDKIVNLIVDAAIYYFAALLVTFVASRFGWIEGDICLYSLALTIGWTIAKMIIRCIKKKSD